jgi:hypothetical protein
VEDNDKKRQSPSFTLLSPIIEGVSPTGGEGPQHQGNALKGDVPSDPLDFFPNGTQPTPDKTFRQFPERSDRAPEMWKGHRVHKGGS